MWLLVNVYNHNKPELYFREEKEDVMTLFTSILEDNEVDVTDKMLADKSYSYHVSHNDEAPISFHVIVNEIK